AVATTTGYAPDLSFSSTANRDLRDKLPWWAPTLSSPSRSVSWCDTRSTKRRVLTKISVVRCALISATSLSYTAAQISSYNRPEFVIGHIDAKLHFALMTDVDD